MDDLQIKRASDWWAERFMIEEKRAEFRAALSGLLERDALSNEERFGYGIILAVDYDPGPTLLAAVRDAGVVCRGCLFSADGILPRKTSMKIRTDGSIEAHEGRGAPWVQILAPGAAS